MNKFVLDGLDGVNILVICSWFNIDIEDVEGFLCCSVFDIYDVPHNVSLGT